jgi:SAM-dependent methyltransferase
VRGGAARAAAALTSSTHTNNASDATHTPAPLRAHGTLRSHALLPLTHASAHALSTHARLRAHAPSRSRGFDLSWLVADAERLPLADASVDSYTIAFGLRNVTRPQAALADAARVLRRGGRLLVLEFSHVSAEPLRSVYDAYSFAAIPAIGRLVVRAAAAACAAACGGAEHPARVCVCVMCHVCADGGRCAVSVFGGEHPPVRDARGAGGHDAGAPRQQ